LLQSRLGSGLSGSREFAFSAYGIWLAGRLYKECAAGACVAPQTLGKESLLVSAPNCGFHGRCFFWNPALPAVPVVLGHFRPLILLPIGLLAGLPPPQMEAVLVHELAHIRRHDYLMNLFQRFAEGLLFYHPAVWWFARVMRNEQEKCCDDVVVSVTGQAHEYALALVALEQSRFRGRQTAIAVTGGNLMKRVHRLLYPKPSGAPWSMLLAVAVFFATACASVAAWQSEPSKQSPTPSVIVRSPYSQWLNEVSSILLTMPSAPPFKSSRQTKSGTTSLRSSGASQCYSRLVRKQV
jgi:hypothetical protein